MGRNRVRAAVGSLAALSVLLAVGVSPTLAGESSFGFQLTPGSFCTDGSGPANDGFTIRLRSKADVLLDTVTGTADEDGQFYECFERTITPGQRLVITGTAPKHSFVVTGISGQLDRFTSTLSGSAPAGSDLAVEVSRCRITVCDVVDDVAALDVPAHFAVDLAPNDIDGNDYVRVSYLSPGADLIYRYVFAPYMVLRSPAANQLTFNPNQPRRYRFDLRATSGALLATASKVVTDVAGIRFAFRRHGAPVSIRAGRRVVGDFAPDANLRVPSLAMTLDTGADLVSATCFPNQAWAMRATPDGSVFGDFHGDAGPDGSVTQAVAGLAGGWTVTLLCENKHGDRFFNAKTSP